MTSTTTYSHAEVEADPSAPIIRITRDFQATPAQLMAAHTDPELFVRWVGPDGMDATVGAWDARNGGEWRYVATRDGNAYAFRGCFHEITDTRIVQTFAFEGMPEAVSLETIRFEALDAATTRMHAQSLVESFAARDAWLASGMESGVHQGFGKLDALLAGSNDPTGR